LGILSSIGLLNVRVATKQPISPVPQGSPALLSEPIMGCLLLAMATLVVYWPVQDCDFINLDDKIFITRNAHIQAGLSFQGLLQTLSERTGGIWQPVTTLTYLLDVTLFGRDPTGPHIINLLWHIANSVLLFLVMREMTGAHWRSLVVAALFALHPAHVESVAWLSERKDVVSMFFGLLALWAYARYASGSRMRARQGPEPPSPELGCARPQARRYYALALLCFVLGLMSKPMLVTLPCLLLLLDFWPLERFRIGGGFPARELRPLVLEKLPFFALSAVACLVTVWTQQEVGAIQPLSNSPLPLRLENSLVAYVRYLGKLFWPADLVLPYPAAPHWPWVTVAYAAALLAGLSALALWLAPRLPFLLTGWLWYLGTLVPVIGLMQVGEQGLADRYTYLPYVGMFLVLSWGAGALLAGNPGLRTAAAALAIALVSTCAVLTREQLRYWHDSGALFTHTLAVTKDNWVACFSLGLYLADQEHTEEAIVLYRRALKLQPRSTEVLSSLGGALAKAGRTDEALTYFTRVLQAKPHDALTHYRLANTLAGLGQSDEAIAHYRLAIESQPDYVEAINNLAVALFKRGRLDEAIEQFKAALARIPNDPNTRCNLANALAVQHRWAEAGQQYVEAARLQPELPAAHFGLASVLLQLGRYDEAMTQLKEVLRLDPENTAARQQLERLQGAAAH